MLKPEENRLLTQTGPGTPMGELFRRYWLPALLVEEVPHPDCPPVRVKLLGEYLVGFRTTDGEVVLSEEYCPHRNASMYFGRNEENGIRCVFHGWKFDKDGKCVDMPSEPPESKLKNHVCLKTYPCKEYGGIVWTYMGPKGQEPEFPEFEWGKVPTSHRIITKWHQECNYVQGIEANMDSSHLSFLHFGGSGKAREISPELKESLVKFRAPKIEAVPTEYGLAIGAGRFLGNGNVHWRLNQFVMPSWTLIAQGEEAHRQTQAWVPMDDENCISFAVSWHNSRPLTLEEITQIRDGKYIHSKVNPGSFVPVYNKNNDYMINRELQATGESFTGIPGVAAQDAAVIESTRGIPDRTREYLGTSDIAIIQVRKRLMDSAKSLQEGGEIPRLKTAQIQKLRGIIGDLPEGVNFYEGLKV